MIPLLFIAFSLSLDAFAVSVSCWINIREQRFFHALRASFCFGLFQAVMPLLGWFLGSAFTARVEAYSGWIAFAILSFIGGKMIVEALRGWKKPPAETSSTDVDKSPSGNLFYILLIICSIAILLAAGAFVYIKVFRKTPDKGEEQNEESEES